MIKLMQWIIFPTDLFFIMLISCLIVSLIYQRKRFRVRKTLHYLFKKPIIMVASIFFSSFLVIALIDSIHIESKSRIVTLLDKTFAPLNTFYEKTYSAPFATHSYSKSIVYDEQTGKAHHIYEPLQYLHSTHTLPKLLLIGLLKGSVMLALMYFIAYICYLRSCRYRRFCQSIYQSTIAWRTALLTFSILILLGSLLVTLLPHYHILGTDKVGQDVFYQSIKSIRTAFIIGFLTSFILLPLAIILGMAAGYFGRRIDDVIQYTYTVISSVPSVLLIAASILALEIAMHRYANLFTSVIQRAEFKLLMLCMIMGMTSWTSLCRLVRAETLKLREIEYVLAARTIGSSNWVILLKHILPNLMHIVIIATALDFSGLVLSEAILSYVGIGVDPNLFSWGLMINAARLELAREPLVWWPLLSAFTMMFLLVLSANLIADALRDALDPKVNV